MSTDMSAHICPIRRYTGYTYQLTAQAPTTRGVLNYMNASVEDVGDGYMARATAQLCAIQL